MALACPFCEGKKIAADFVPDGGIHTMKQMLSSLFGNHVDIDNEKEPSDYIQFDKEHQFMRLQSSSGEYSDAYIAINFCPICGVRLNNDI